ncbi:glycosyltransferase [Clostridium fermenticellae]|uniref:Glycosyltransferase n=1 Tax=Clostridium fermenticellae TaxID=2068654 RepID=A0A386H107_9CLOT|nr:glycosyltransferase family 4 protein [Clostridium fermenticellae]AYD39328.1 glycosyltransferase [Clostridium fermenticellae]
MKKILFFTTRSPIKPSSGREISLYYYIKYLHELYNYEIVVFTFGREKKCIVRPADFIHKLYTVKSPSNMDIFKNVIKKVIFGRYPLQVAIFYSLKIKYKLDEIIKKESPDILISDMVRTSEYFKDYKMTKIFDMDDMLSLRYKSQLESEGELINPFGAYFDKLPGVLKKILDKNYVKIFILKYEQMALQKYEVNISNKYDAVVLVSPKEVNYLNEKMDTKKAFVVSTGVDCKYFEDKIINRDENIITFLGVYSAPHNEDAVLYFYRDILPAIKKTNPNLKLRLVGGNVTKKVEKLKMDASIELVGRVEDVRDYIKSSKVFVAPLRFGSGIKTKILEAMAMEVPVVTTSVGAEGIGLENYENVIIQDDPNKFAKAVCELVADNGLYNRIAKNAKEFVMNNYDWNVQMKSWKNVFDFVEKDDNKCRQ